MIYDVEVMTFDGERDVEVGLLSVMRLADFQHAQALLNACTLLKSECYLRGVVRAEVRVACESLLSRMDAQRVVMLSYGDVDEEFVSTFDCARRSVAECL